MKILLSNDDGIAAEGLRSLAESLAALGSITVVAPDRNRSGASNSLTLDAPLRVVNTAPGWYAVNGTPTDCVHLAISGLLSETHDLVVTGVNDGANLGDDVLYSGTVAGAIEARFLGLSTIAVSVAGHGPNVRNFATGAQVARELIESMIRRPLPEAMILNVNVPDVPYPQLKGLRATRLGFRHRSARIVASTDPRGRPVYWIGAPGAGQDAGPGTDFHAVADGYVSVTPLSIDLTRHGALPTLDAWLAGQP
jgi:5'-nucleotidase